MTKMWIGSSANLQEGDVIVNWSSSFGELAQPTLEVDRPDPLPKLPNQPHTVIATKAKKGFDDWELKLDGDGKFWRNTKNQAVFTPSELLHYIKGFEVLAWPRGEEGHGFVPKARYKNARAILVQEIAKFLEQINRPAAAEQVREKFGVQE